MYETVWMRWFRLLFGSTSYAASVTLCAYFAGLAIGAAWLGRAAGRSPRPLRLYAGVELGIAATALIVPLAIAAYGGVYPALYASLADAPALFVAVKLALALAAMLPCAICIGGALPPLAAAALGREGDLGREGSALYAANVLGGVVGAAAGGLLLPEWLGVNGTYAVGVGFSLCVAALAAWAGSDPKPAPPLEPSREAAESAPSAALWVAAVSGFGLLAFEVLLVHALGRFFSHSAYSFGLVLVAVLSCLTLGAALVSRLSRRFPVRSLLRGALLLEAALLLALPWAVIELREVLGSRGQIVGFAASPLVRAVLAVGALGVPALLVAALVFPLTFRLASGGPAGPRLGGLLAVNTLGGIAGSLAASFVLLEAVGLWGSFALLGLAYAAVAPALADDARGRAKFALAAAALAGTVALLPLNPWRLPAQTLKGGERLLAHAEGAFGLVAAIEMDGGRFIAVDEHYRFGDTRISGSYERSVRLPLLLHPDPKRVAVIGSATGGLAASTVEHAVEEIVLVEMVPEVHHLAATWFAEHNRAVHRDPRTRLVTEDGRNHLRATRDRYDVIVEDLYVPHRPSAAAMYSRDHYRDAFERLGENGVFCQWLPLYQLSGTQLSIIVATFLEVFPEATLWTPSFRPVPVLGLVGLKGPAPSVATLAERGRQRAARGIEAPWLYDPVGLWSFYLGPAATLAGLVPAPASHSDAEPLFEFVSARTGRAVQAHFSGQWPRLAAQLVERIGPDDPVFPGLPRAGPRGGIAMLDTNHLALRASKAELQRSWQRVGALLPERLLAHRDPKLALSLVWPEDPSGGDAKSSRDPAEPPATEIH